VTAADPDPEPVDVWTDGACSGNPGPGGWGVVLRWRGHERELSGGEPATTNNRMELRAVIEGLRAIHRPSRVVIHTDAAYLERAFMEGWLERWQRNGWRTTGRKPVANQDLWQALAEAAAPHTVRFERVRGHAGVELNERADQLAVAARDAAGAASPAG
jgi:ribonuclease HI